MTAMSSARLVHVHSKGKMRDQRDLHELMKAPPRAGRDHGMTSMSSARLFHVTPKSALEAKFHHRRGAPHTRRKCIKPTALYFFRRR